MNEPKIPIMICCLSSVILTVTLFLLWYSKATRYDYSSSNLAQWRVLIRHRTILILALFISGCAEKPGPLNVTTAEEKSSISAIIEKASTEPILEIERIAPDTVKVTTGFLSKIPLEGGGWATEGSGHEYNLKKTKAGWTITAEGGWST